MVKISPHPAYFVISSEIQNPLDDVLRMLVGIELTGVNIPKKRLAKLDIHGVSIACFGSKYQKLLVAKTRYTIIYSPIRAN